MIDTYPRQRQETSLFVSGANEFSQDGSDLYFADYPDDMVIAWERIAWLEEQQPYMNQAVIEAERVLLEIMEEFRQDQDVFHPHTDLDLQKHLYEQMRARVSASLGAKAAAVASDSWLSDRIAFIRGFPPYRYDEEE